MKERSYTDSYGDTIHVAHVNDSATSGKVAIWSTGPESVHLSATSAHALGKRLIKLAEKCN